MLIRKGEARPVHIVEVECVTEEHKTRIAEEGHAEQNRGVGDAGVPLSPHVLRRRFG